MDIGQILQKYKGLDFLGMSKEEVDKFVIEIVGDLEQIKISRTIFGNVTMP